MNKVWIWAGGIAISLCIIALIVTEDLSASPTGLPEPS